MPKTESCTEVLYNFYGQSLSDLSAVNKFNLIGALGFWQSWDTELQSNGKDGLSFGSYVSGGQIDSDEQLQDCFRLLSNINDDEALDLISDLILQLKNGDYSL